VVATIVSDADDYAETVAGRLRDAGLRAEIDCRNEKISYKVREHSVQKVPVLLAVGQREVEEQTVAMRRLGELESRLGELADWKERPIVVLCHHGHRSERAARMLLGRGFARVENLDGGIDAWSITVDPAVHRY